MDGTSLIRDMAACERPETRLERLGPEAMKDEELLTLLLGMSSLEDARGILAKRPLKEMLTLTYEELKKAGMSRTQAFRIVASRELMKRLEPHNAAHPPLRTVSDIAAQCIEIRDKKKEHLLAFYLNARHEIIKKEVVGVGILSSALLHPRELFAPACGLGCAAILIGHNHPSGDPSPSDEDIRVTKRIQQAGHIMGIELLDHVIVAERGVYSFKTAGML